MKKEELFKFCICDNFGEISIELLGKNYTDAESICEKIKKGILDGSAELIVNGNECSFSFQGITLGFRDDLQKMDRVKKCIKRGIAKLESFSRGNFDGFRMSF